MSLPIQKRFDHALRVNLVQHRANVLKPRDYKSGLATAICYEPEPGHTFHPYDIHLNDIFKRNLRFSDDSLDGVLIRL